MLELAQCLRFNLTDTFARYRELLTDFFKRMVSVHADTETHTQHAFFTRCKRCENAGRRIAKVCLNGRINWQQRILVFDEITQV